MAKEDLSIKRYFFWGIILILIILSYLIVESFIIPLVSAFVLAYLVLPVQNYLKKKINKNLAALVCILIIILLVMIPISILATSLITQAYSSLNPSEMKTYVFEKIDSYPLIKNLKIDFDSLIKRAVEEIIKIIYSTLSSIPSIILALIIIIISVYYILVNWEFLSSELKAIIPFKDKKQVAKEIAQSTNQIVYGYVLIAIIEFIVVALGFYISGVNYYILFSALMALLVFIPGIGPGIIWISMTIFYIIAKDYPTAIGVLITGLIAGFAIEEFLFMKVVGKKSKIHPLILLIGVIGGVPLFGIFGFIIGPLILVYTIKMIEESIKHVSK